MGSAAKFPLSYNTSTYGSGIRDYDAGQLSVWEVATSNDLVTAMTGEVLDCYNDAIFNDTVLLNNTAGFNDADYFRVIRPATGEGHNGTVSGVRFEVVSAVADVSILDNRDDYSQIHNICAKATTTGSGNSCTCFRSVVASYGGVIGCIAYNSSSDADWCAGFLSNPANTSNCYFINCLAYNVQGSSDLNSGAFVIAGNIGGETYLYNCTAFGSITSYIITTANVNAYAKNCISQDPTSYDFGLTGVVTGTWNKTTCVEDDSVIFVDEIGRDYHLATADTGARGNGTDLSADGVYPFDDDVNGVIRSAWDIGFAEYVAPIPTPPVVPALPTTPLFSVIDHVAKAFTRIITQYRESSNLKDTIESMIDESQLIENAIIDTLNLRWLFNAEDAQLDSLGALVGQSRTLDAFTANPFFGFDGAIGAGTFSTTAAPSTGEIFYSLGVEEYAAGDLTDDVYRLYIRAKILFNTTLTAIDEVLYIIEHIVPETPVEITWTGAVIDFKIYDSLTDQQKLMFVENGLLPHPVGTSLTFQDDVGVFA